MNVEPLRAEIVVIGSGPGGAITTCLLAEAGRQVLLVEEGPHLPLDSCAPFSLGEMVQKYRNGGITVAMGKPKVAYVEGRCAGGGSEVNAGLYHRTPPEVLDEWSRQYSVERLSADELAPHFETCERELSVSLLNGPAPAASLKLHQGAKSLGWKSLEVPRWVKYENGGETRQLMTETYLPRAIRAGCRLMADTRVLRLRRQGSTWRLTAVRAIAGSPPEPVAIEAGTVFVAAGAVQSAALLRRSGLTQNVGRTLSLHPTVKVLARFPETVNSLTMGVGVHQVKEFSPRASFGCSISSPPYLRLAMLDHPQHMREVAEQWTQSANYYAMLRGGLGRVDAVPGYRDPLVRYRLGVEELAELARGLADLCRCLFAAGAVALYPGWVGAPRLTSLGDLARLPDVLPADRANLITLHLCGSCPMGENRALAAADSFGRVHGAAGLWLADGSLLCNAPGVNPQGTIMALVRRNALEFLAQRR